MKVRYRVLLAAFVMAGSACSISEKEAFTTANHLYHLWPSTWFDIFSPSRMTDGYVDLENSRWNAPSATGFGPYHAQATFDLGDTREIGAVLVQADKNDGVLVEISTNGKTWYRLWSREPLSKESGLHLDIQATRRVRARYARIRPLGGDHAYGIAEFQLLDRPPADGQTTWHRRKTPVDLTWSHLVPEQAQRKVIVGALALLVIICIHMHRRKGHFLLAGGFAFTALAASLGWTIGWEGAVVSGATGAVLLVLGHKDIVSILRHHAVVFVPLAATGALAWTNFGMFHGTWEVHYHDAFHYYVGPKYFKELGHRKLYDCAYIAERDSGKWPNVHNRGMRDLRTNKLKAVEGGEEHAKACRARFSPSRWQEFVADIDFFIAQIGFVSWSELLYDHGYNATPAWNSLYSSLVERLPCNERSMALLALIDPLLYALGFGVFCLAFGLKTGALALLIWGIGFPWVFFWNGASIGRGTWFAAAAVGLGLLRLRRPLAGGVALGISGAMRALPALALAGPAVAFIAHLMTRKRADRERLVILIGACATGLVLVFGNSLHSWSLAHVKEFIGNSVLHAQTRAKNVMGVERMARYGDPFRGDNEEATGGSRPLSTKVVTSVVRVALLALWVMVILRLKKSWAEASLGFMLLLIVFEISSYYCAFFCLLAPLASGRLRRWLLLLGSTLATQIPALFMSKMPSSDYYAYASALLLVAFALLAVDMLKHPWEELPTPGQSGQE